jgi:hypothetical protein
MARSCWPKRRITPIISPSVISVIDGLPRGPGGAAWPSAPAV